MLKDKPFFLEQTLNSEIFQLDYSLMEDYFQNFVGPPHPNQKALLERLIEEEA